MQMESPWDKGSMQQRDLEEVQDDGLQGHDNTYGIKPEAIE